VSKPIRISHSIYTFVHGMGEGWSAAKTGDFANRLGALVASRAGAVPEWSLSELGIE
jgi:fructokinase